MTLFRMLVLSSMVLLTACTSKDESAFDWNRVNYQQIACSNSQGTVGCANKAEDIMASGRSKGR